MLELFENELFEPPGAENPAGPGLRSSRSDLDGLCFPRVDGVARIILPRRLVRALWLDGLLWLD